MRSSMNKMAPTDPPPAGDRCQVVSDSANLSDVCVCVCVHVCGTN